MLSTSHVGIKLHLIADEVCNLVLMAPDLFCVMALLVFMVW